MHGMICNLAIKIDGDDQFNKVGLILTIGDFWGILSKLGSSLVKLIGKSNLVFH
jgi:hypothetical protein